MKRQNRIGLLIGSIFLLGTGSITAYQSLSNTIAIVDNGRVTQYETFEDNVAEVLEAQAITLGVHDTIIPSLETEIEDGTKIIIERFRPTITLVVNDEEMTFDTDAATVGEIIELNEIKLEENGCSLPLDQPITDGLVIEVKTTETFTEKVKEAILFETEVVFVEHLLPGEEEVVVDGRDGLMEKEIEIVLFGGEEVSRAVVDETLHMEPRTEVIHKGAERNVIVDEVTGKVYKYTEELTLEATAYVDIPGDRWYGITASGMPTFVGMVAVDRNLIPLGTMLYVEGYGIAIAGDVGGAIKGHDIDLFMDDYDDAIAFGRRDKQVFILEDQTLDIYEERALYK